MKRGKLLLIKNGKNSDITSLVCEDIGLCGSKNSAARSLTVTLIDTNQYGFEKTEISVGKGQHCAFYWDGKELFQGIIMLMKRTHKKKLQFTAYDVGIYLSNNRDTFIYTQKTASEIFTDICQRYEIPHSSVASTNYVIPELIKKQATVWDALCDALSQTYKATNIRYYPYAEKGKMNLSRRSDNALKWVVKAGDNLIDYSYSESIENTRTRIKLLSNENLVVASASNNTLENYIGIFQEVQSADDSLTESQLKSLVDATLNGKSKIAQTFAVSALGIAEAITGKAVYISVPDLSIARAFYIEQDSHTFSDAHHTMNLTLNYASDIGA